MYFPQPSVRSYQTGLWHLESCSMMVRMRAVVHHMPSKWEWLWMLPPEEMCSDDSDKTIPDGVSIARIPWGQDVHANRWMFPADDVMLLMEVFKPDMVYAECSEHVASIRYCLDKANLKDSKIMTQIGYVPMHSGGYTVSPDPIVRQFEGAEIANAVIFNSDVEQQEWYGIVKRRGLSVRGTALPLVWNGLYDPDDVKMYRDDGRELGKKYFGADEIPRIFYAGRMADPYRTHYKALMIALDRLKQDGKDFRLWVGNPNEAWTWENCRKLPNYEEMPFGEKPMSRRQYLLTLWAANIVPVIIPNRTASFCEAVETDNIVLSSDLIGFDGEVGKGIIATPLEEDDEKDSDAIYQSMTTALERIQRDDLKGIYRKQSRWVSKTHAVHKQSEEIQADFEAVRDLC